MAQRHTPKSYDEIIRRTVVSPDLSYRASHEEEQRSRHRFGEPTEHRPHAMTAGERDLCERVVHCLAADSALDLTDVTIEIDRDEVVLLGTVPGPATAIRIEEIAAATRGVTRVDNQLIVRSRRV